MLFTSPVFLFLFLPLTLAGNFLLPKKMQNYFLLIMSLLFYAYGEPRFVLILIASTIFNSVMAIQIDALVNEPERKKAIFVLTVIVNLGILFCYKYMNFTTANLVRLGIPISVTKIVLPIGISFFTFQAMSYVIDVYRGNAEVQKNPLKVALYISLFPQLVAGPIVRYSDVAAQIDKRTVDLDKFSEGVHRFIIGFAKKILLANNLAWAADLAFNTPDAERTVILAWLGIIAYSFQILFDFSGYSDMAIGLGKMLGFDFLENFDYPYKSKSVSEFWRRWHMSLGSWFRDYVYFPLGGSRVETKSKLIRNLFVVWLLTGVWHGASWNFVAWGLGYFILLTFEKLTGYPNKFKSSVAKIGYRIFTLLSVMLGWVVFRADGFSAALGYLRTMLYSTSGFIDANVIMVVRERWVFFLLAAFCSAGIAKMFSKFTERSLSRHTRGVLKAGFVGAYIFLFVWSLSYIVIGSHDPFIYFNF